MATVRRTKKTKRVKLQLNGEKPVCDICDAKETSYETKLIDFMDPDFNIDTGKGGAHLHLCTYCLIKHNIKLPKDVAEELTKTYVCEEQ